MNCPMCNRGTRVIDSRPQSDHTLRVRKCLECNYRFNTVEVDEDMLRNLKKEGVLHAFD